MEAARNEKQIEAILARKTEAAEFLSSVPLSTIYLRRTSVEPALTADMLCDTHSTHGCVVPQLELDRLHAIIAEAQTAIEERVFAEAAGERRILSIKAQPVAGMSGERLIAVRDMTAEAKLEEALQQTKALLRELHDGLAYTNAEALQLALHDPLTGLPNRRAFDTAVSTACQVGNFALCLLDMDHFKQVNDQLGHSIGDKLLRAVADRLRAQARGDDFVARLGGDEFAIILHDINCQTNAIDAVKRLLSSFDMRLEVGELELKAEMTAGVALAQRDSDPAAVYHSADLALHAGKSDRRGGVAVSWDSPTALDAHDSLMIAKSILKTRVVPVAFDPIVDPLNGVVAHEAIIDPTVLNARWSFPIILETAMTFGLGPDLIATVLASVTEQVTRNAIPYFHLALPACAFEDNQLAERIVAAIQASPVQPSSACIEFPLDKATVPGQGQQQIGVLRRAGLKVIVSDWSMSLPGYTLAASGLISGLKFCASGTSKMLHSSAGEAFLTAGIGSVAALGVPVFAAGVDDAENAAKLFRCGVRGVQGKAFATPSMSATALFSAKWAG